MWNITASRPARTGRQTRSLHSVEVFTWSDSTDVLCGFCSRDGKHGTWGAFSATFSLADAIFRILQTKLLIKRQLDSHVSRGHKSPDHLSAPGIRVGEFWALDHSFSRHCYDLLLMGILDSWKRKEECLLLLDYIRQTNWPGLNHLDTKELLYIIHLTRAQFYRTGTLLYDT